MTFLLALALASSYALAIPIDSLINRAMADGYWAAREDSTAAERWTRGPLFRLRHIEARDERDMPVDGFTGTDWSGESASRRNVAAVQAALQILLAQDGFAFAETVTRLRADSSGMPAVDLFLHARRGAAHKLGEPLLRETRTRPTVARRLALWELGENFDPERIEQGLRRLRRGGYFESADWTGLYRDSVRHVLYPLLRLPDARANTVGGLLGYDSEADAGSGARLTGFLDIRLVNILGTARDFSFAFDSRTGREREVRGSYTEPWLFTLPVGARWEGGFLQQDTVFWEWNQSLFVFRDLDFTSRIEAEFGAQENSDVAADSRTRALSSGVRVIYDSRDRVPFTRSGLRGQTGVTGVRRTLEGGEGTGVVDSAYYLAQVRAALEGWHPLTERLGLKLGVGAATNYPLNRLNRGELHDVGGARSLRGYREREFQTNAYLLTDAELQFTVGRRGRLFGFASPGLVNRTTGPAGRLDPRRVLGYGAGMELSQGDWSVALTYALNPDRSVGNGYLHAAVENRF